MRTSSTEAPSTSSISPATTAPAGPAVGAGGALALDRVGLAPAGDPWQRRGGGAAPAADRLAMVEAAIEGIEGLGVSPLEVERHGPSYTYQTLEALSRPGRALFLIVGADVAATMRSWVGVERLPGLATLVGVHRVGDRPPGQREPSDGLAEGRRCHGV